MTSWKAKIFGRKSHATRSASAKGTNITGQGFFSLPSELRNVIYEHVLADAEHMRIDLESGPNKKHKVQVIGAEDAPKNNDSVSPLNILLACKQINNEATGIAYSKMSLSLLSVWPDFERVLKHEPRGSTQRFDNILKTLTTIFRATTLSHVTSMDFPDADALITVQLHTSMAPGNTMQPSESCTHKCDLLSRHKGLVHCSFHKIRRLTLFVNHHTEKGYRSLKQGASWLSPLMDHAELASVLGVFSNLEEVVVHRECGIQVSDVIDGKIFVKGSGVPYGGFEDWLPTYA